MKDQAHRDALSAFESSFGSLYCDSVDSQLTYVDWQQEDFAPVLPNFREGSVGSKSMLAFIDEFDTPRAAEFEARLKDPDEDREDVLEEIGEACEEIAANECPEEFDPASYHAYPIPLDDEGEAQIIQARIRHLPIVIARVGEQFFMAYSGGGMDMSWEMVEAFAIAEYAPPVDVCRLPIMAGRGKSVRDLAIIGACIRSLEIVSARIERSQANLDQILNDHRASVR